MRGGGEGHPRLEDSAPPPQARSGIGHPRLEDSAPPPQARRGIGRVARYAQGKNYHWVIKNRLHAMSDQLRLEYPEAKFRTFVDTVPVLERELAEMAGIGWQAKNTMVINARLGSYLLLGGVATTLELLPPPEQVRSPDHCGTCTRCIDACPTQAITPYSVDGSRCISYLTIEHREVIDPALHEAMGDWVYGCDICQEVCPHNSAESVDAGGATPRTSQSTRRWGSWTSSAGLVNRGARRSLQQR